MDRFNLEYVSISLENKKLSFLSTTFTANSGNRAVIETLKTWMINIGESDRKNVAYS